MRAVICSKYGKPDVLQIHEVAVPLITESEFLVKIYAASVTSSDCYIRGFNVKTLLKPLMGLVLGFNKPRQPILGMVYAGIITEKGPKATKYEIGDYVYWFDRFKFGTYAEYKKVKENDVVGNKPDNISFDEAAVIPY